MTMLTSWDPKEVQWFDNYEKLWDRYKDADPMHHINIHDNTLGVSLGLPVCVLSPEQSKFFKRHYNSDKHNLGPLVREIDVIRKIEGW